MSMVVRVMAPIGRDAELITGVLQQSGLAAEVCTDPLSLLGEDPIGPLLIAEEALSMETIRILGEWMRSQPTWSDLPVLILTGNGRETSKTHLLEFQCLPLGAPVLLERPIRTATLVSSVRAALRARQRQYEIRDSLRARDAALAELKRERETLQVVLDNSIVGVLIGKKDDGITYANQAILRLLGYTADEVAAGKLGWNDINTAEYAEADRQAEEQMRIFGTADSYHKELRARDGRLIPFLVGATIIPSQESQGDLSQTIAVFLTDMSRQKQAESALIQSEKLAAVGRLAASISHEINNPLEAVTNILYIVEGNVKDEEAQRYIATAQAELQRVSQIVTHTLRFHRQATSPRALTAEELLEPTIGLHHGRLVNSNIDVQVYHCGSRAVVCYEGDIRQVLNNLIGNAIDSMKTGGRLLIRTRDAHLWNGNTSGVRITIADTGHGMTQEVRERIFEPFYTTKGINGTGLGLWISSGIVDKHRGLIQVHSTLTKSGGTVFSLFLPDEFRREERVQEQAQLLEQ
ncbi:ATP-binding protein [Edaphobacter paludis]|uniref:histidine kinase n=1 Tax=Edaphobacter paludis TaxID=3035702 RepID=A0AAU7D912_9BACT